ncbi:hypothetical protein [Aquabacterium humicola]|uniref:hypothetical protein n=1 Tax=Aquabacterium humicola TaxID=3237377 RepID=UPI002543F183|nr:hypothetical protein [Rubrivivax pictus]
MEYLGLLCLGAFVGAIATVGLRRLDPLADWRRALVVLLPALLAGMAMVFVDRFRYSPAFGAFPLGLLVSLLWTTIDSALERTKASEAAARVTGWVHVATAVFLAVVSTVLAGLPASQQVIAEAAMPRDARLKELQEARGRANLGSLRTLWGAGPPAAGSSAPALPASAVASAPAATAASAALAASGATRP